MNRFGSCQVAAPVSVSTSSTGRPHFPASLAIVFGCGGCARPSHHGACGPGPRNGMDSPFSGGCSSRVSSSSPQGSQKVLCSQPLPCPDRLSLFPLSTPLTNVLWFPCGHSNGYNSAVIPSPPPTPFLRKPWLAWAHPQNFWLLPHPSRLPIFPSTCPLKHRGPAGLLSSHPPQLSSSSISSSDPFEKPEHSGPSLKVLCGSPTRPAGLRPKINASGAALVSKK